MISSLSELTSTVTSSPTKATSGTIILILEGDLSSTTIMAFSDALSLNLSSPVYAAEIEYSPALSSATVRLFVLDKSIANSVRFTLIITLPVAPFVTSTEIVVSVPTLILESQATCTSDFSLTTVNVVELNPA